MKRDATALRAITHADDEFTKGQVILGMRAGQFDDWEGAGMVRAATDAEIAKAKGEKPAKPKKKTAPRTRKASAPAPAGEQLAPPTSEAPVKAAHVANTVTPASAGAPASPAAE